MTVTMWDEEIKASEAFQPSDTQMMVARPGVILESVLTWMPLLLICYWSPLNWQNISWINIDCDSGSPYKINEKIMGLPITVSIFLKSIILPVHPHISRWSNCQSKTRFQWLETLHIWIGLSLLQNLSNIQLFSWKRHGVWLPHPHYPHPEVCMFFGFGFKCSLDIKTSTWSQVPISSVAKHLAFLPIVF